MTEYLEQRVGKVILITPIFETSAKSNCVVVADEAADEDVDKILNIPHELYDRLFSHQKYGVRWLYGLYSDNSGGILGKISCP
jgi:SNF2 family DNA or RNA helicase